MRLDVYLAENKMIKSRELAKKMISEGGVTVNGEVVTKPAKEISEEDEVKVTAELPAYVGRGGLKLEKALDSFHIDVSGLVCMDIGASTGGFTDCLLQRGVLHRLPHLLQKLGEFLLRLIPCGLQLFKGFQCAILAAELRQKIIHLRADLCRKFGRSLVSGQLPPLADRLDRGIVRILGHMVEQLCVEFLCLCCETVRIGSLREQ